MSQVARNLLKREGSHTVDEHGTTVLSDDESLQVLRHGKSSQPLAQSTLAECALPTLTIPSAFAVKSLRHALCKTGANVSMVESANQQPLMILLSLADMHNLAFLGMIVVLLGFTSQWLAEMSQNTLQEIW